MNSRNIWPRSGGAEVRPERANRRSVQKVTTRTLPNSAGRSIEKSRMKRQPRHKNGQHWPTREPALHFPHKNVNRSRFSKPPVLGSSPSGSATFFLQENAVSARYSRDILQTYSRASVCSLASVRYAFMSSLVANIGQQILDKNKQRKGTL